MSDRQNVIPVGWDDDPSASAEDCLHFARDRTWVVPFDKGQRKLRIAMIDQP
jgi:hypothetical protein